VRAGDDGCCIHETLDSHRQTVSAEKVGTHRHAAPRTDAPSSGPSERVRITICAL